jgi:hypothetical protein
VSAAELVRRARGGAAKYARMTAEDVVELGQVFWQVARRQARDTTAELGGRLGHSLKRSRRGPGARR